MVDRWEGNVIEGRSFVSYTFETRRRLRARHLRWPSRLLWRRHQQSTPPSPSRPFHLVQI